jgi:tetratricopeptide (TPR) repeat protein
MYKLEPPMKLEAAICPNCGGDLRIPDDRKTIVCMYCGKTIIVQEAIAKANSPSIENYMELVKAARDSHNFEEAYAYCNKILELNPKNYLAWYYKGDAAGWQSTIKDMRFRETLIGIDNAHNFAPQEEKSRIYSEGANLINSIASALYDLCIENMYEYGSDMDVQIEFIDQRSAIIGAWVAANTIDPSNKDVLDSVISALKDLIKGVEYKDCDEYETIRIDELMPETKQDYMTMFDDYVNKRKALDPSYQPPQICQSSPVKKGFLGLF